MEQSPEAENCYWKNLHPGEFIARGSHCVHVPTVYPDHARPTEDLIAILNLQAELLRTGKSEALLVEVTAGEWRGRVGLLLEVDERAGVAYVGPRPADCPEDYQGEIWIVDLLDIAALQPQKSPEPTSFASVVSALAEIAHGPEDGEDPLAFSARAAGMSQ